MAEKSNVFKQSLKHVGFWDYKEFYNFLYEWLVNEGYILSEDAYTEKLTSFGKEVIIEWKAKKKVTDYFRNIIELKWHIIGMNDAEVEINGKKQKTNKGEVKIAFSADLEKDYEEKWSGKPFNKFLRGIYDKYIIRTTADEYEDRLLDKVNEFFNQAKSFLNLEGKR